MEWTNEWKDQIDRLTALFELEGRNILELPEQSAAFLAADLWQNPGNRPEGDAGYALEEGLQRILEGYGWWNDMLDGVQMVRSVQLRHELESLVRELRTAYPNVSIEDCSDLGDMSEYLLDAVFRSGNKNCFFTPRNIARFLIELVHPEKGTLWDPACGSGAFLVEAMRNQEDARAELMLYGTDISEQMVRIAKINRFFHGIREGRIVVKDALKEEGQFDFIVTNPPVVMGKSSDHYYGKIAPTKSLHLQFLQMAPEHLKHGGVAAVLVNESVLFSRKGTETKIRRELVENYGLWAVFSLPRGAFSPYTNAKSSVILFGRDREPGEGILFYELRHLGYTLDKKHVKREENDFPKAVEIYRNRAELFDEWKDAARNGSVYNVSGVLTPADWPEADFWFAARETVREQEYILSPDRYRPLKRQEVDPQEDYRDLLERLYQLERQSERQMDQLMQVFSNEWM